MTCNYLGKGGSIGGLSLWLSLFFIPSVYVQAHTHTHKCVHTFHVQLLLLKDKLFIHTERNLSEVKQTKLTLSSQSAVFDLFTKLSSLLKPTCAQAKVV